MSKLLLGLILVLAARASSPMAAAAPDDHHPFEGEKTSWRDGFERFDYLMDEETLDIQPFKRGEDEEFGIKDPPQDKRRCVVIVPKRPALNYPWSWRGCYWDHQPQAEVELLRRGFHVAYISANGTLKPGKTWDAWYAFLTEKHGLSKKSAFIGMSASSFPSGMTMPPAEPTPGGFQGRYTAIAALKPALRIARTFRFIEPPRTSGTLGSTISIV